LKKARSEGKRASLKMDKLIIVDHDKLIRGMHRKGVRVFYIYYHGTLKV
jgi:hypothetical protein